MLVGVMGEKVVLVLEDVLIVGDEDDMSVEVGVSVEVVLIKGVLDGKGVSVEVVVSFTVGVSVEVVLIKGVLDGKGVSVEVVVSFTVGVSVEVGVLKEGVLDEEGVSV